MITLLTASRSISTVSVKLAKEVSNKAKAIKASKEVTITEPCSISITESKCPADGSKSTSVCLYDSLSKDQVPCTAAEVDSEWEIAEKSAPKGPRIVIIGAGIAGLTAAERLIRVGHNNLVILEADCRAGGRLRTRWAGDTVVELGGLTVAKRKPLSWDHPLLRAGLSEGIFSPPAGADPTSGLLDSELSLADGFSAYSAIKEAFAQTSSGENIPGLKGVRVEQTGRTLPGSNRAETARLMTAIASLMGPQLQVVEDGFGVYAVAPGGTMVPLGESYLLMPLLKTIGKELLVYRKEVVSIRWGTVTLDQLPRSIVRCRDGSEYPAEFVIITCSLGNLKDNLHTMFFPPLPTKKVMAIEKLQMVQENRAYLIFDYPIWSWSPSPVDVIFTEDRKKDKTCWSNDIKEMKQVEGSEKVIGVRVVGEGAVKMERCSKEVVMEILHFVLEEKLGIGDIPKPKNIIRSHWCDSYKFRGSHTAGGDDESKHELAAPLPYPDDLPPILLFAGEATATTPGPQGAVMSGLREAERLAAILDRLPTPIKDVCPNICK